MIRKGGVVLGGNKTLKIYGQLNCGSGKRMKMTNGVFFGSEDEARAHGYRPCGHCMRSKYQKWKNGII
jgi:methylphosphotriester-DNA--protein-cysteine methyltransferase